MVTLTLMRHGLVENPGRVIYGALPGFGLSAAGKQEITRQALAMKGDSYDKFYASPLQRAQETAEIVRRTINIDSEIITDERLREWVYVMEGLTLDEWQLKYPKLYELYHRDPFLLPGEVDGQTFETFKDLSVRMSSFVDEIKNGTAKKVLAISHGDPIMMILHNELKEDFIGCREHHYVRVGERITLTFDGDTVKLL